jgi:S-methylmethionine-dependent homocysteine/selenocysteine methylase
VPNIQQEQKLHHKYSLLVKQYSVGEAAFHYWNELKKTSQEQGWLFDRQPALLNSNIRNINDEDEDILGFFTMSGVEEKRGFAEKPEGLDLSLYKWYCFPVPRGPGGPLLKEDLPLYYARAWMDGESSFSIVNKHCVDCRAYKNSSHIKPEFW